MKPVSKTNHANFLYRLLLSHHAFMRNYKTLARPGSNGKHHLQYIIQHLFNIAKTNMCPAPPASADDHADLQGAVAAVVVVAILMEISGEMPLNALVAACRCAVAVNPRYSDQHQ